MKIRLGICCTTFPGSYSILEIKRQGVLVFVTLGFANDFFPTHTHFKCYVCKQLSIKGRLSCVSKARWEKIKQVPKYSIERSWTGTFCIPGELTQRMVINLSLIIGNCISVAQRRNHRKIIPMCYSVFFKITTTKTK